MSLSNRIEASPTQNKIKLRPRTNTGDSSNIKDPKKCRRCPVCGSNLNLYYINFEQMFLMCEDSFCDFPFGYEPLQIVHNESQLVDEPPPATPDFWEYPIHGPNGVPLSPLGSVSTTIDASTVQSSCASDCGDPLSLASDDSSFVKPEILSVRLSNQIKRRKEKNNEQNETIKKLNKFIELNEQLNDIDDFSTNDMQIKNKKWIKKLNYYETLSCQSGTKLLKDGEMDRLKKEEPDLECSLDEVEICVDPKAEIPTVAIRLLKKTKIE